MIILCNHGRIREGVGGCRLLRRGCRHYEGDTVEVSTGSSTAQCMTLIWKDWFQETIICNTSVCRRRLGAKREVVENEALRLSG
jgi:hypothetical protein